MMHSRLAGMRPAFRVRRLPALATPNGGIALLRTGFATTNPREAVASSRWKGKAKETGHDAMPSVVLGRTADGRTVAMASPAFRRTLHSASSLASTSRNPFPPTSLHPLIPKRHFRSTPTRRDVLGFGLIHCSIPALKSQLLSLTRMTLIILPFWYRWKMGKRFPRASMTLIFIPVFAICLVVAIGIDQSPRTSRWRLLLMTEREEMEWSHRRFDDLLASESPHILPFSDPRVQLIKKICDRLITALDVDSPVSAAVWPRDTKEVKERLRRQEARRGVTPSARTASALMPFRPETSNPEKVLEERDWDLFVVDLPKANAFVLPTKEIFVYTGLLDLLSSDEDLVSAILAHEVSHVVERHAVENLGFSALSAVVFDVIRGVSFAFTMSFPVVSDALASVINYLDGVVASRAYSRKLEGEADELGLQIMANAGYDPRAGLALWGLLNEVEEEQKAKGEVAWSDRIPWTRTHPTGADRQKAIEQALPKAMKMYRKPLTPAVQQSKSGVDNTPPTLPRAQPSVNTSSAPTPARQEATAPSAVSASPQPSLAVDVNAEPSNKQAEPVKAASTEDAAIAIGSSATPAPSFLSASPSVPSASDPVRRLV